MAHASGRSEPIGPEREARYRWAARTVAGGRVLDAGCGTGWGTALLASTAEKAIGVDFAPGAIADALAEHGQVAEFREGDLRALPFAEAEFDSVVCFEAVVHVADPAAAIGELCRVLRPGGLLLVSAPNPEVYPPGNPLHLDELNPAALERLLQERFANVALHRQRTCFATQLGETVEQVTGEPRGEALHTIAAASDGALPPAPALLVLGEEVDYTDQRQRLEEWRERAVRAEAEAEALRRQLRSRQD